MPQHAAQLVWLGLSPSTAAEESAIVPEAMPACVAAKEPVVAVPALEGIGLAESADLDLGGERPAAAVL